MDFEFATEHESFRKEFRDWLAAYLRPELCLDDASDDRVASDRETFERRRVWQKTMHAAGWVGITWPKEYGGRDAGLIERVIWDEEYTVARAPVLPGNMGLSLVGPTIIHWHTRAEAAPPARYPQRRRDLVPGLLRARRRLRSGEPPDTRRRSGRSLRRQRAEGLDVGRALRPLDHPARPHQSRRAQASGDQLPACADDEPGHHRAAARADDGAPPLQRGLLHRRRRAEGQPARAGQPGMEGLDDHAHVRAPLGWRAQPHGPDRAPDRAGAPGGDRRAP